MQLIIKLFPEVNLKSQSVQRRFSMILQGNISNILHRFDASAKVERQWDKLVITSTADTPENRARYLDELVRIPGIQYILDVVVAPFVDQADILAQTRALWGDQLAGKSFCVRVRRNGEHPFSSLDLQKYVGAGLATSCVHGGVRLGNPDVLIQLEVQQQTLYLVRAVHQGLGGYPLGTQEEVLSLISGGFDSALASMQMIKRGCRVHYCFFNLGGDAHLRGVQQMAAILWNRYGSTHRVRFIAVDFTHVLGDIVEHISQGHQGVVLKRAMLSVADQLARQLDIPALVTGDALGQVASQTLTNLNVVDRASETVVLRPLISWDKPDIIEQARRIGVAALAESIPEYCGAISRNPSIKAGLRQVEKDELMLDSALMQHALEQAQWFDVRDLSMTGASNAVAQSCSAGSVRKQRGKTLQLVSAQSEEMPAPPAAAKPARVRKQAAPSAAGDVVIDVRAPDEAAAKPLRLADLPVQCIPFYKIASTFAELDPAKRYLLYCARGAMSQLQVAHLRERGFDNVDVYRLAA
jgi:thiamine biosynthesis protein ThiI